MGLKGPVSRALSQEVAALSFNDGPPSYFVHIFLQILWFLPVASFNVNLVTAVWFLIEQAENSLCKKKITIYNNNKKKPKKYNNHKLQQQQKNSNNKLQKPKFKITKITTKIHNRKNYKPLFTGIITQLASLVLSLSLLPCMDTRSWSRLELGVQVSVPRPFQVPSRLTHTFPSS